MRLDDGTSLDGYHQVFRDLRTIAPLPTSMRILIRRQYREGLDDEPYDEVIGRDGTLNRDTTDFKFFEANATPGFANSEVEFGLDFQPRAEWLGMVVEGETMSAYAGAAIVALCIHEMTFFGFSEEQVTERKEEIGRRAEEVRAMSEAERQEFLIPTEEVFKHRGSP